MAYNTDQLVTYKRSWMRGDAAGEDLPARVIAVRGDNQYTIFLDDLSKLDVDGSWLRPREAREGEEYSLLYEIVYDTNTALGLHLLPLEEAEDQAEQLSRGGAARRYIYTIKHGNGPDKEQVVSRWVKGVKCAPDHRPCVEMHQYGRLAYTIPVIDDDVTWALNAAFRISFNMIERPSVTLVAADGTRTNQNDLD